MRAAAKRRLERAWAMDALARDLEARRMRDAAVAPWAPAIREELEWVALDPAGSAKQLRAVAREMASAVTELRIRARQLDAMTSAERAG